MAVSFDFVCAGCQCPSAYTCSWDGPSRCEARQHLHMWHLWHGQTGGLRPCYTSQSPASCPGLQRGRFQVRQYLLHATCLKVAKPEQRLSSDRKLLAHCWNGCWNSNNVQRWNTCTQGYEDFCARNMSALIGRRSPLWYQQAHATSFELITCWTEQVHSVHCISL